MTDTAVTFTVRRAGDKARIVDVRGAITAASESALMAAYTEASEPDVRAIVLNFNGLEYMNSGGIGLLVTLLVRINRQRQRLLVYGLNEHYRHIFELTRLTDAIGVYDSESAALAFASAR